jgi:adhesin HecA-like repeat protein
VYTPLIWARGDVEIRGGIGQGLLLADGDVTLSAGALFAGLIITRDDLLSTGTGGTVFGAVLAGDDRTGSGDHSRLDGSSRVQRSACAVQQALERSARIVPVPRRSWGILR